MYSRVVWLVVRAASRAIRAPRRSPVCEARSPYVLSRSGDGILTVTKERTLMQNLGKSGRRTQRRTSAAQRAGEGTRTARQARQRTQMRRRHYQETTWQKMRPLQDSEERTQNRSWADTARAEHDARSRRRRRIWTGERHGEAQQSATRSRWGQPRSSGQWAGSTSGETQACGRRRGRGDDSGAKGGRRRTAEPDKEVWERSARATRKVLQAAIRRAHVEQKEWTKKQGRTQEKKQREKVKTSRRLHAAAR